mmetsp:Transcript_31337/g.76442  ORF Transcript_31337/g.76442 Transcript_31337/m.76442 type:complete len:283 (-) Transcript_31337:43-891(-)
MASLASSVRCFGGFVKKFVHQSSALKCEMTFTAFIPSSAATGNAKASCLYYLSGLTCSPENFITKAGAFRAAEEKGIVLIAPDTSPRGIDIEGQDDSYDFGSAAGFYLDATEPKWAEHYNMYTYITKELKEIVNAELPVSEEKQSIFGHSMGGHGALTIYLKNPGLYRSVSAFSPICNPTDCPWGVKAFTGYLGAENKEAWDEYDATLLLSSYEGPKTPILVDQGTEDTFLEEQLKPQRLEDACEQAGVPLKLRMQDGYDHSYYFISTFVEDHINFHAQHLR